MFAIPKPLSFRSEPYNQFLRHLRDAREAANLTQDEVARRMGKPQSFISKSQSGERRIDIIELLDFCAAIGKAPDEFVAELVTIVRLQAPKTDPTQPTKKQPISKPQGKSERP